MSALTQSEQYTANAEAFASITQNVQGQRSQVAQYALSKAATYWSKGKNDEAIVEFKKVLAFDPTNKDAHASLGKIYQGKGNLTEAIKYFKTGVELNRTSVSAHNNLGNAYLQAKQYTNAEKEFKTSARMDPVNPLADYTLGIMYSQTDRLVEAETQFKKVGRVSPRDGNVPYSLGALYNKMGRPEDAIKQLQKALTLKKDLPAANYELGAAYAKLGDTEHAEAQFSILDKKQSSLSTDLRFLLDKPQMAYMESSANNRFNQLLGPGTPLWMLDPSLLSKPDTSAKATVAIHFTNKMDIASVMNPANWEISRAKSAAGGYYNNSMPVDVSKEALIEKRPFSVSYDPKTQLASVVITLQQNDTIDILNGKKGATIDPSHIVFKFTGKDAAGRTMAPSADEIDGYNYKPF